MTTAEPISDGPVRRALRAGKPRARGETLRGRSRWADLDGPVHYLDFGGPAHGPLIVAVHGLGGAAVNWSAIAPLLTRKYRLLAPDLAGHGLTRSEGRGADVRSNRSLLHRFIESVSTLPVILMGNSMGGMIAVLETAAEPDAVAGLILVDPALPFQPVRPDPLVAAVFAMSAVPILGPLLIRQRRLMPVESVVSSTLALCCVDPKRVPPEIVERHIEVARQRAAMTGNAGDFANAARSVLETASFVRGQSYRRGIRDLNCPVLIIHGQRDRLVPVSVARMAAKSHPAWTLAELPDIGHVPQLEAPVPTATAIKTWLAATGKPAARAASPVVRTAAPRVPAQRKASLAAMKPLSEVRQRLSGILARFRREGAAAEPVAFGSHRKPEAISSLSPSMSRHMTCATFVRSMRGSSATSTSGLDRSARWSSPRARSPGSTLTRPATSKPRPR
jgi:pimeloyl-ACP methyl ester carboxylesterase